MPYIRDFKFRFRISCYENNLISPIMVDAWFLAMLALHAIAGEYMNAPGLCRLRQNGCFLPDQLLMNADQSGNRMVSENPSILTNTDCALWDHSLSPFNYYGREQEMFDLNDAVHANRNIVLTGAKGVGKTELLKQLLNAIRKDNRKLRIAALSYDKSLIECFTDNFLNLSGNNTVDRFREVINILDNDTGYQTLIFIDGMDETPVISKEDLDTLAEISALPCTIFITSVTSDIPGFTEYHLEEIDVKTASLIFRHHYGNVLSDDEKELLIQFLSARKTYLPQDMITLAKSASTSGLPLEKFLNSQG